MSLSKTASQSLRQYLAKASGAGSRGGHIIGHTRSGKPIYASGSHKYLQGGEVHFDKETRKDNAKANFSHYSQADHRDAIAAHNKAAAKLATPGRDFTTGEGRKAYAEIEVHNFAAQHHHDLLHHDE